MSLTKPSDTEHPSHLSHLISLTQSFYSNLKHSHTFLNSTCLKFEPLICSAAAKLTSLNSSTNKILSSTISNYKSIQFSLSNKKKLYKASISAWLSTRPKSLNDFIEAVKSKLHLKWLDSYDKLVTEFYYKSLNYHPQKVLKLLADILSQGSESLKSALESSRKSGFRDFLAKLKETLADKWIESYSEAGRIYKSIWKAKEKLLLEHEFSQDWRDKARKSAEIATLIIFTGVDELYIWSLNNLTQSYAVLYKDIWSVLPFKGIFLPVLQQIQAFDKQDLLELTWPEDLKTSFEPLAAKLGLEASLTQNWSYLDCDEDGTVTISDICAVIVLVIQGSFQTAMQIVPFKNYISKN